MTSVSRGLHFQEKARQAETHEHGIELPQPFYSTQLSLAHALEESIQTSVAENYIQF